MFLIHRKRECECVRQGINWNIDDWTKFQISVLIWHFRFNLRVRRRKAFDKFDKEIPHFYWNFEIQ
jgi:hypothetical protein